MFAHVCVVFIPGFSLMQYLCPMQYWFLLFCQLRACLFVYVRMSAHLVGVYDAAKALFVYVRWCVYIISVVFIYNALIVTDCFERETFLQLKSRIGKFCRPDTLIYLRRVTFCQNYLRLCIGKTIRFYAWTEGCTGPCVIYLLIYMYT